MLEIIKYNKILHKFHKGLNWLSFSLIDISVTSLGCFTDFFKNGNGRRVELNEDEIELTVNSKIKINNKEFNFSRCYTNCSYDTTTLDKKQDVYKYAKKISDKLSDNKIELPLIAYYNNVSEFKQIDNVFEDINDILSERDYGYKNCLIVHNKFHVAQVGFVGLSLIVNRNKNILKYKKIMDDIQKNIKTIGCSDLYYDVFDKCFKVKYKNKTCKLSDLEKDLQIYISIIMDLNIRSLILNPQLPNPQMVNGCVAITYSFNNGLLNQLVNYIFKTFHNVQLLVLDK